MPNEHSVRQYLDDLRRELRTGRTTEHSHRPALKRLVEAQGRDIVATNEPQRVEVGSPDFEVARVAGHGPLKVGRIEAKDIGVSLAQAEQTEQLQRYLGAFDNLILTDYLNFRWYLRGALQDSVTIAVPRAYDLEAVSGGAERLQALLARFLRHEPEPVRSPSVLASSLARLAQMLSHMVFQTIQKELASPTLRDFHQAFREVLIPDLTAAQFADMFSQTLAYGLFAARVQHDGDEAFDRYAAAREIPRSNPFLRRFFATISGPDLDDEPYVGVVDDIASLLNDSDFEAILANFGSATRRQDPIFHFYETFLVGYDPDLRERRGVYYTPEPVVSYITRSVDALLVRHFGIQDGLADTTTTEAGRSHRVFVLDPAVGTGTFLYEVIDLIRERFRSRQDAGLWDGYVREHLLPRLFGFELMMAPYAVAHLKLGLQLAAKDLDENERDRWTYDFASDERLGVYLTNSLQEAVPASELVLGSFITDEANAAAEIKRELPIMVVLGNPPYSGHSANASTMTIRVGPGQAYSVREQGRWIGQRVASDWQEVEAPTFIGRLLDDYYHVEGAPLGERNPKWLQDDYVKFIRFGQWRIEETGSGVLAFITNHAYLDNSTFRGMRQELLDAFSDIYILDLHGNQRKRERSPDGRDDENVFDIRQGVAIALFVLEAGHEEAARVHHSDLWGPREEKYSWLAEHDVTDTPWSPLEAAAPHYVLKPLDRELNDEWHRAWGVFDILPVHSVGIATHRDHLTVATQRQKLVERIEDFLDPRYSTPEVRERYFGTRSRGDYPPGDKRTWRLADQRPLLQAASWRDAIIEYQYRPFDYRVLVYHDAVVDRPRREVMRHMTQGPNLALAVGRAGQAVEAGRWNLAFVSRVPTDLNLFRRGGNVLCPTYLYRAPGREDDAGWFDVMEEHAWDADEQARRPNLDPAFVAAVEEQTGLAFRVSGRGDLVRSFGPEDVLAYIYAVLWAPSYRERFASLLDIQPPRVPVPTDLGLFGDISALGHQLIALHTLAEESRSGHPVHYPESGANRVEQGHPRYVAAGQRAPLTDEPLTAGRVYISSPARLDDPGQYFEGVAQRVWDFRVGGFQVCEKFLRERQGTDLTYDERTTYMKMVAAIDKTLDLLDQIDAAIPGWPLA